MRKDVGTSGKSEQISQFLNNEGLSKAIAKLKTLLKECEHISDTSEFHKWIERSEEIRLRGITMFTLLGSISRFARMRHLGSEYLLGGMKKLWAISGEICE